MRKLIFTLILLVSASRIFAQQKSDNTYTLLKPDRVFDGEQMHSGWWVLVKGNRIQAVGEPASIKAMG
jgi:hypothetical protein